VYKEEKAIYAEDERIRRLVRAERDACLAEVAKAKRQIMTGNGLRVVLAEVKGRADREQGAPMDPTTGLPIISKVDEPTVITRTRKKADPGQDGCRISEEGLALWEAARVPKWLRDPSAEWVVPESDGEDELEPDQSPKYDAGGEVIPFDYWPSTWRKSIAEEVNDSWIGEWVSWSTNCVRHRR
jgi:hypothetical protein